MDLDNKERIADALNQAYAWMENSVAAYMSQAAPYVEAGKEGVLKLLKDCAEEDRKFALELGQAIQSLGQIPRPGVPDPMLTELNYLSVTHLCKIFLEEQRKRLAQVDPLIRELAVNKHRALLDKTRSHIESQIARAEAVLKS